jgi:L-fucono-1,5-lactonase
MLNLPVIDAHHHFGGDDEGPDALRPELERGRITGTVLAVLRASVEATRAALELAAGVTFVRGVVGWVDLGAGNVADELEALRHGVGGKLLVGVRHDATSEVDPAWLCRHDVRRGLRAVEAASLAFDLVVRTRELPAASATCAALPGLRFVLEHLACPPIASGDLSAWGRALLELAELPNVSAILTGLVSEADPRTWSIDDLRHPVELALDAFGPGRLMLGSDWPRCLEAGSYSDVLDAVSYLLAELPVYQLDDVRGTTAVRVYRLSVDGSAS